MKLTLHSINQDPFFFDGEELRTIADEAAVRQGLAMHKENRVFDMDYDREGLWAMVEDEDISSTPLDIEIRVTGEKELSFSCQCQGAEDGIPCSHMVAVLYAYADRHGETNELLTATDSAIKARMKRGRSEVQVESLNGGAWFGDWRASSVTSTTHFPQTYRVTIRSLRKRANFCTCPDFANNQLGTCKHIEAVLHKVKKHPDYHQFKEQTPPFSYVYLAWDVENAPRISLHRTPSIEEDLEAILGRFFDSAGGFQGRLPDEFFRFREMVGERADINMGLDAIEHANHLAAAAAHKVRSREIHDRIRAYGGRLPGIRARLYPYQIEGTAFLAGTGRALLADDMGLGKTLQAIAAAAWLSEHENVQTTMIICPASLKQQWAREIAKFTDLKSQIIQGPPRVRGAQYRKKCAFYIINYELILRDLSLINESLRPDLIILDEAQRIKNWRTKVASAVKLIPSRYAFVLSGTPLENRLEDLYSLMQVVDPRILGPLWRYMVDFHVTDERDKVLGYRNLSMLRQRLAPVMLRRDRRIVKDQLPDRITQRLDVAMTPKQIELHNAAMNAAGTLANIAKKRPLTPSEQNRLMAALQQARMAGNAAGLVDKETEGSPKLDELTDILDELCIQSGLKAVVFSQWELMTRMVEKRLRSMGLGYVRLHGGVPTAKRGALMDRFREDDDVQIFVSTDAGGVGLNLQSGSVLINLDVPWNPAVLEQRNGRIHRLGQTRTVQIITIVAANSYEEDVLAIVHNKQNLFDNVIGEDGTKDVVGVSKKLLETLVETLGETTADGEKREEKTDGETVPQDAREAQEALLKKADKPDGVLEKAITSCIQELQNAFGPRIERILGSGGGILTILDKVTAEDDLMAAGLSDNVPVAVIDQRTLSSLARLGTASPVANSVTYYDAAEIREDSEKVPRLTALAVEKFKAARILVDQQCSDSAVELICSALLAAASGRADLDNPILVQDAGVWIYGDALPKGILNQDEAALIMRGITLAQSPAVPQPLIIQLMDDAEPFINA
ncbi:MAG: helicase [Desulfobacteraceae bacterium 4572_123]|nr:MAG: helicase [Desulfobacteraceae bacterium 4572_123]